MEKRKLTKSARRQAIVYANSAANNLITHVLHPLVCLKKSVLYLKYFDIPPEKLNAIKSELDTLSSLLMQVKSSLNSIQSVLRELDYQDSNSMDY